jgi:hypothetical protein
MGGDPGHHGREISSLGEDRGALDHLAAGSVRTRQPRDQSANRLVVHVFYQLVVYFFLTG